MPVHMTDKNDNGGSIEQCSKAKLNTFDEDFCKTGINPEGLIQFKPSQLKTLQVKTKHAAIV